MEREWRKIYVFQEVKDTEKRRKLQFLKICWAPIWQIVTIIIETISVLHHKPPEHIQTKPISYQYHHPEEIIFTFCQIGRESWVVLHWPWNENRLDLFYRRNFSFLTFRPNHFLTLIRKTLHKQGWTKKIPSEMEVVSCSTLLPLFLLFILFKLSTA